MDSFARAFAELRSPEGALDQLITTAKRLMTSDTAVDDSPKPVSGSARISPRLRDALPALAEWLIPLAILFALVRAIMGPAFFSSTQAFGTLGDTNQYMWFIGWFWHALAHGQSPFVTSAFEYPRTIQIMDYTSVPTLGLLFGWMVPFAGLPFTIDVIIVSNYALIFIFGKLILRSLDVGPLMSGLGGLLFCLLPYLTAQESGHLNLAFIAPHFIVVYLLVRIVRAEHRPGWVMGLLMGFAWVSAFYTFVETFLTLAVCIAVVALFALISAPNETWRVMRNLVNVRFLSGFLPPLALIVPGVISFLVGQPPHAHSYTDSAFSPVVFSNDLLSLVVPSNLYLMHTDATTALTNQFSGNNVEWNGYVSIPMFLLFFVHAAREWRRAGVRMLTYAALAMLIFSLGPLLHVAGVRTTILLPWSLALLLPFVRFALPARLGFYAIALIIVVVVLGVDATLKRRRLGAQPIRYRAALVINLAALALVSLLWAPTLPYFTSRLPVATDVLRNDRMVPRYIGRQPTLVLDDQNTGFNIDMGILAGSDNYDVLTPNVYGYDMVGDPAYQLDQIVSRDIGGARTNAALRRYLPAMGVRRVMFLSTTDRPLDAGRFRAISQCLGAPIYDHQGLVIVWTVPTRLAAGADRSV